LGQVELFIPETEAQMRIVMNKGWRCFFAMPALALAAVFFAPTASAAEEATPKAGAVELGEQALPAAGAYSLDAPHTFVFFSAMHEVVGLVRGRFNKMSGTLVVSKDLAGCSVDVSIEAGSIDTQNTFRDEDLRSASFFDAAEYPLVTYRGRGLKRSGKNWVIEGKLSIRGVERSVPLVFSFNGTAPAQAGKPSRVAFHAKVAPCKRADFNMTRDLLDEIGPKADGPDVWIEIDAEALATGAK
jgi:polyisoprenoid-binding protein YceI